MVLNLACENIFDINYISKYYNNLGEKKLFKNLVKEFNSTLDKKVHLYYSTKKDMPICALPKLKILLVSRIGFLSFCYNFYFYVNTFDYYNIYISEKNLKTIAKCVISHEIGHILDDSISNNRLENSKILTDILEKMMDAKIDDEIVINTINNMLLLKSSDEEMFSTLDLGIIDLKKGTLETIKMGACSTYIKRNDKDIDLISSSSLPVGILSDIKLDRKITKVNYGDYIIMVSDGILDAGKNNNLGDNWLIYFLQKIKTTNPKEIANLILDRALEIQDGVVEDDMTVLVTKVCSN